MLDDAQGEGLGRAVWQVMRDENPQLFWRSRHGNVVNDFYYAESDGVIASTDGKCSGTDSTISTRSRVVSNMRTSARQRCWIAHADEN